MAEKEPMNIGAIVNGFESPNIPQISQPNADDNIREIPHIDLTSSQEGRKKSIEYSMRTLHMLQSISQYTVCNYQ